MEFERKLKGLTRGTAAAKTLSVITKMTREAATQVRPLSAGDRGRSRERSHSVGSTASKTGGSKSRPASASASVSVRPHSGTSRSGAAGATGRTSMSAGGVTASSRPLTATSAAESPRSVKPLSHEMTLQRPQLHPTAPPALKPSASSHLSPPAAKPMSLYDDSHKRHVRDFVAIKMKEERSRAARSASQIAGLKSPEAASSKSPTRTAVPVSVAGAKAAGAGGSMAASSAAYADAVMFAEFFSAKAPQADDRKFDVWFKAHIGSKGKKL